MKLPNDRPIRVCLVVPDFPSEGPNQYRHGIGTQSEMIARAWASVGAETHVLWYGTKAKLNAESPIVPVQLHKVLIPSGNRFPNLVMVRAGVIVALALRRLDHEVRFDVIEGVNDEGVPLSCALMLRERFHLRLSTSLEQSISYRSRGPTLEERTAAYLTKLSLRFTKNLLSHSLAQIAAMRQDLGTGRVFANVPLGIADPGLLPPRVGKPLRIGSLGTLSPRKGIDVLLRAIKEMDLDPEEARFVLVGKHQGVPLGHRSWESWAEDELGIGRGTIEFTGPLPDTEVVKFWASIDIAVIPSRWESFGLVAVEAMARGVPVVVASGGSLAEVVADAGLIVPAGDPESLAAALHQLISSPEMRAELAERGRRRFETEYTLEAFAQRMKTYYFGQRPTNTDSAGPQC